MSVVLLENWEQCLTASFSGGPQTVSNTPFAFATSDPTRLDIQAGSAGRFDDRRLRFQWNGGTTEWARTDALVASGVQEWVVGMAVHDANSTALVRPLFGVWDGTTLHLSLVMDASDKIAVYRGTTSIATSAAAVPHNQWFYLEMDCKIDDTVGVANVYINGSSVITFSGDTRNAGNATADRVSVGSAITAGTATSYLDDIYAIAKDGSGEQALLGDLRVVTLRPSGAGNQTDFTPSAGSNYQNVDDPSGGDDGDTTYNSSSTAGHIDLFALDDLPSSSDTVYAIEQRTVWRMDDAGPRTARHKLRTSSTNYSGSTVNLSSTYTGARGVRDRNPNTTNRWTASEVNALEAGYELVS